MEQIDIYQELLTKYSFLSLRWGFEIGPGWYQIIKKLLQQIKATEPKANFKIVQIKEKFGGLRVYCQHASPEVLELIDKAALLSYTTCESCGRKAEVKESEEGWLRARCGDNKCQ